MPSQAGVSRRAILRVGGSSLALGAASLGPARPGPIDRRNNFSHLPDSVFTLGVASGEPRHDGVVLWTRLAPEPLSLDGLGGMPPGGYEVRWEVAEDPGFRRIARRGSEWATERWGYSVHAEVGGLRPRRDYWYRFRAGRQVSTVGRTRTAPHPRDNVSSMTFAFTSCQHIYYHFTALDYMANEDLDLVLQLGDYIYEGPTRGTEGRPHVPNAEIVSLADFRVRHAQYKTDPALQAAHAAAPWVTTPDDHDVKDNWGGDYAPGIDAAALVQRRAVAYQAYYENLPFRRSSIPRGSEMQIYRRLTFGNLLQLDMLDTRRFRNPTPPVSDASRWDEERTILGPGQERWLLDGLARSRQRWKVLGNQVLAMELDHAEGDAELFSKDLWDAYAASRQRLFDGVLERDVNNFVMVTGDAHQSVIGDLKEDFSEPSSRTVGAELLGTSITSGGDGIEVSPGGTRWLIENPHMKWHKNRRGYQVVNVNRHELTCDYKVIPFVSLPDAPLSTIATAYVENGRPGIAHVDAAQPSG